MHWLDAIDGTLFRWINSSLGNPALDALARNITGGSLLPSFLLALAVLLLWKGGTRGRLLVVSLCLIIPIGQFFIADTLKEALTRARPFETETTVRLLSGLPLPHGGGMPSGQTMIWFSAATLAFIFYRRSIYFLGPYVCLVGFTRIYSGFHYPSDVLAGAILGIGCSSAGLWLMNFLWNSVGGFWFPLWYRRMPNLFHPVVSPEPRSSPENRAMVDAHLIRLGVVITLLLMVFNLAFNASGAITLSEDEAYQWTWSKHLALSYYSKPLLIALAHYVGTHLWGDTVFGVRFFPPIIAAVTSLSILKFLARVANARVAFWMSIVLPLTPLLAVGSILMTIDPLNVMFWIFAMIAGWSAIQEDSTLKDWLWVGVWMGLGFLSKYTSLFQLLSWVLVFILSKKARLQLSRPGPWMALLINLLFSLPVLIWNSQHHWITIQHVSEGGRFDQPWQFTLANLWHGFIKYTLEFAAEEVGLQNPFFFIPAILAALFFWRKISRQSELMRYFFSMGAPIFVVYLLLTFHSRALPNWIAPSIIPFFCLGFIYWEQRFTEGYRPIKWILISGIIFGVIANALLHDLSLVETFTGYRIPDALDSTRRVKGWAETAAIVENARQKLELEGKPAFIIGGHYGVTGEMSFQLPEARTRVGTDPLVFFMTSKKPQNQFFFWPGYADRKGQNAIFVQELSFTGTDSPPPQPTLLEEFESVTDIGPVMVMANRRPMRRIQLLECRGLR